MVLAVLPIVVCMSGNKVGIFVLSFVLFVFNRQHCAQRKAPVI